MPVIGSSGLLSSSEFQWGKAIQLLEAWLANPDQLEDVECRPPTGRAINEAIFFARHVGYDKPEAAPNIILPNRDGGVILERAIGSFAESIEINDDGTITYMILRNGHVEEHSENQSLQEFLAV